MREYANHINPIYDLAHDTEAVKLINNILASPALARACIEGCEYALGLRTGEVIHFEHARIISPEWIHIATHPNLPQIEDIPPFHCRCGIDVRLADIVWVADVRKHG